MSHSRHRTRRQRGWSPHWTPRLIIVVALLVVSLLLMLQNWRHVDINLLFWDLSIRLVWVLLSVFLLGALLGYAVPHLRAGVRGR